MTLPDVSRFEAFGADTFRALGKRLRTVGLDADAVAPISRICERLIDPLRTPMRRYHLRKRTDLVAYAMRMFVFGDPVTRAEAQSVLGEIPLERAIDAGVLTKPNDEKVVAPFLVNLVGPLYVMCDDLTHGEEAVMGAGNTTADVCRAAASTYGLERVLDLGCGAGTAALFLAERSKRVIATDINPRAIVMTRANAMLNGIDNVDVRLGDMFAPVAGETFDLVVSQPPFIAQPEGAADATYLYGGRRGDEIPLRLLRELPPFLAPGGRAVVLVDWPIVDAEPLEKRVRTAVGDDALSVLLLRSVTSDLDEWCSGYAAIEQRSLGEAFEKRALERREHFDRVGITTLRMTFNVIVRTGASKGWTRTVDILPLSRAEANGTHIDALVATTNLMQQGDDNVLAARLRLPNGTEIIERGGKTRVVFRELLSPVEVSRGAAMLAAAAQESNSVREAIAKLSAQLGKGDMTAQMLAGVRQALEMGVLQVEPAT